MTAHIDLRHLRYFIAVAEERSFRGAAERLHISQPPLSRQIRQLEEELGVDLLERGRSGASLTAAGEAFLPEAQRTLEQAERAVRAARSAGAGAGGGRFVLGYTPVFDRSAIPDVFDRFRRANPDWNLVVKSHHSRGLVRDIRNGAMDAAFVGWPIRAEGVALEVLREEPVVAALPASSRAARKRSVALADLRDERMYRFQREWNPLLYDRWQALFDSACFAPPAAPQPPDHHILLGLIADGRGFALIPESLRNTRRKGVVFRPLREGKALSIGMALAYPEHGRSPVLAGFMELVRTALKRERRA
jgi:DNA-binding transcriptional LysR family regulator